MHKKWTTWRKEGGCGRTWMGHTAGCTSRRWERRTVEITSVSSRILYHKCPIRPSCSSMVGGKELVCRVGAHVAGVCGVLLVWCVEMCVAFLCIIGSCFCVLVYVFMFDIWSTLSFYSICYIFDAFFKKYRLFWLRVWKHFRIFLKKSILFKENILNAYIKML